MAETSTYGDTEPRNVGSYSAGMLWTIAWRNIFRNKRRTWLTVAAIVFACFLVSGLRSYQVGMYKQLAEISTEQYPGHAEVIHMDYEDEQKLEQTILAATELMRTIEEIPMVKVAAPRVTAASLFSVDEKAFGGLLIGADFAKETQHFTFFDRLAEGELPVDENDVVLGKVMARNLGIGVGDEVVVLGSQKQGGIAALVLNVSGIFSSGTIEFDRSFAFVRLSTAQEALALGDEVHALKLILTDIDYVGEVVQVVSRQLPEAAVARGWQEIIPELYQGIRADDLGGLAMMALLVVLILFSIANTFSMMVFERTREFGMLLSLGMRPWAIIRQVQFEAMGIWLIGAVIATILNVAITYYGVVVGVPVPAEINEMFQGFYFVFPERFYPAFSWGSVVAAPLIFLIGIQVAALVGAIKILWLEPVAAMRSE